MENKVVIEGYILYFQVTNNLKMIQQAQHLRTVTFLGAFYVENFLTALWTVTLTLGSSYTLKFQGKTFSLWNA